MFENKKQEENSISRINIKNKANEQGIQSWIKTTLINFFNFLKVVVLLFLSVLLMTVDISEGLFWSRCKRCIFRCQRDYTFCKAKILEDYCGIKREACWKSSGKCWKQGYCVTQQTIMGLIVIINLTVYLTSPDLLRLN